MGGGTRGRLGASTDGRAGLVMRALSGVEAWVKRALNLKYGEEVNILHRGEAASTDPELHDGI